MVRVCRNLSRLQDDSCTGLQDDSWTCSIPSCVGSVPNGPEALAEQLAEAVNLLREIGTNASTPADVVEAGIADYNETILQWAQRTELTAFAELSQVWWYSVRTPSDSCPAFCAYVL